MAQYAPHNKMFLSYFSLLLILLLGEHCVKGSFLFLDVIMSSKKKTISIADLIPLS